MLRQWERTLLLERLEACSGRGAWRREGFGSRSGAGAISRFGWHVTVQLRAARGRGSHILAQPVRVRPAEHWQKQLGEISRRAVGGASARRLAEQSKTVTREKHRAETAGFVLPRINPSDSTSPIKTWSSCRHRGAIEPECRITVTRVLEVLEPVREQKANGLSAVPNEDDFGAEFQIEASYSKGAA